MTGKDDESSRERYRRLQQRGRRDRKTAEEWSARARSGQGVCAGMDMEENSYVQEMLRMLDVSDCKTLLDVGCGPGTLGVPLALKLDEVFAVDFSDGMLERMAQRMRERQITNCRLIKGSWLDESLQLPVADVVLASRCLDVEDMHEALLRLDGLARRRVYVTYRVGQSYLDKRIPEAVGRTLPQRPSHVLLLNVLDEAGIEAELRFVDTPRKQSWYEDYAAFRRRVEWSLGPLTEGESDKLRMLFDTFPVVEDGRHLHEHAIRWALISWEKQ